MIERTFIHQGIKRIELEEYLRGELEKAGFTKSSVVKTPMVTRIVVNVTRPGLAIGKSGQNIRHLTETIEKRFGIDNPQLEIKEITSPELDAAAVANKMKALIERGFSWRSVTYRTLRDVVNANAQGVEILLSGKLAGKGGRKRKQRVSQGYMKKVGDQVKLVDFAKKTAYPKAGAIGIKVRIVRPGTVFPDKVDIADYFKKDKAEEKTEVAEVKKEVSKEVKGKKAPAKIEEKAGVKKEDVRKEKAPEKKGEKVEKKAAEKKTEPKTEAKEEVKKEGKKEKVEKGEKKKSGETESGKESKKTEKKNDVKKDEKKGSEKKVK
ncbi:MAG: 30S ribosomal protein S3 [Candidatus Diapherotrites archaeon]